MIKILLKKFHKNTKLLKKFQAIAEHVNSLENSFIALSDDQLKHKTIEFKDRIANNESLDKLLPEAFATIREASKRVTGKRHFDVQIIGGIALHNGMITEMLTGEGKTLVSTLATYLNALTGKGVHIITVNDYLAKRDAEAMGLIFNFLGLTVGCVTADLPEDLRKDAYNCDITYGTNNEFGFDYLRDNMKLHINDQAQRNFNFAIIDEVDSVLIDEARTPLIISGPASESTKIYQTINGLAKFFNKKDFEIDEKQKSVHINEEGLVKFENLLNQSGIKIKGSLFDSHNLSLYHLISQSLRAHHLYNKDVDYIIKDNEIIIIDEFTGRMMDGRRFSEGLHQALEAKEGVKIRNENQTLASITLQNYFKMYPKLAGMTGTALTEANEFLEIYSLNVVPVPPNKPVMRKDYQDIIYKTYKEKEKAIVNKIIELHKQKRPVLIGTVSIERSENLSNALKKAKVPHEVLNAKNHEKEAFIIAQAGTLGAVTIATNMAGRGTDIQLGGNLEMLIKQKTSQVENEVEIAKIVAELTDQVSAQKQQVVDLGGLAVIGTERHESRRIDNQLRGRSGRQGEPGMSVFFLSLEDDLMRIFGGDKLQSTLQRLGFKDDEAITHSFISKAIEKAQKKVEEYNFQIRKNLLRFDSIINEQRKLIYEQRKEVMTNSLNIKNTLYHDIAEISENLVDIYLPEKEFREKWDFTDLEANLSKLFNLHLDIKRLALEENIDRKELANLIITSAQNNVDKKEELLSKEVFTNSGHHIMLQNIDFSWKKHLSELDYVRSAINLRAYGQKDPFHEYQLEAFNLFSSMLQDIKENFVTIISHLELTIANTEDNTNSTIANPNNNEVSRNSPCPCGSGKKFKHCCGNIK
ncbi:preprotein translocase subunit SecA [Rickettsiales bacterium LUAb2]